VAPNPENAIVLPPWKGDPDDKGLIELVPFLECEVYLTTFLSYTDKDGQPLASINLRMSV
jgi:hypothetical protein